MREHTIEEIAFAMSEMYEQCDENRKTDFWMKYQEKIENQRPYLQNCKEVIAQLGCGIQQKNLYEQLQKLADEYEQMFELEKHQFSSSREDSQMLIEECRQKYQDYMILFKENLRDCLRKLEFFEETYEAYSREIHKKTEAVLEDFQKELDTEKIFQHGEMQNRFCEWQEDLLEFEVWSEEKKQQVLVQIAELSEVNQRFYQIYQKYVEGINKDAKKFNSISVNLDKMNQQKKENMSEKESDFQIQPIYVWDANAQLLTSMVSSNFIKGLKFDVTGGLVEFLQGKEEKVRYRYEKKYKTQIENALHHAIENLYQTYDVEMQKNLDSFRIYCEKRRDSFLKKEVGSIEDVKMTKQKINELLQQDTDFLYKGKNLMDLLFAHEHHLRHKNKWKNYKYNGRYPY